MNMLIIAGGRDFNQWEPFYGGVNAWFDEHDPEYENTTIVCGMALGADTMGRLIAEDRGVPVKAMYAQWNQYGKRAGGIRNQQMAEISTHLIAFWDGISPGTRDMIMRARILGLGVSVVMYTPIQVAAPEIKVTKALW